MTIAWTAVALVVGSAAAGLLGFFSVLSAPPRLLVENHRGERIPAVLGLALVGGLLLGTAVGAVGAGSRPGTVMVVLLVGVVALAAGGLADDAFGGDVRGLRGHIAGSLRGHPTTGALKLALGVAAGVTVAVLIGGGPIRVVAASVLIAACVNLWNALDVVPGRSLKWAVVALVPLLAATRSGDFGLASAATLGAAAGVLPLDLTERAMLGDAGSNPLGLVVGTGLALTLPTWGVVGGAGLALLLQAVAETVTISRLIGAAPPLRWFDRLGRRP